MKEPPTLRPPAPFGLQDVRSAVLVYLLAAERYIKRCDRCATCYTLVHLILKHSVQYKIIQDPFLRPYTRDAVLLLFYIAIRHMSVHCVHYRELYSPNTLMCCIHFIHLPYMGWLSPALGYWFMVNVYPVHTEMNKNILIFLQPFSMSCI